MLLYAKRSICSTIRRPDIQNLTVFSKVSFFWPLQVIFFSRKSMPTVLMNLWKEKSGIFTKMVSVLTSPRIECVVSVSVEKTGFAYTWVPKGQKLYKVVIFHTPSILLIWDENTCSTNHCFVMILVLPSLDILFCSLCYTRKVILPQVFIYYDRPEQSEHTSHTITNVHTMNMLSSYSPGLHSSGTLDKLEL